MGGGVVVGWVDPHEHVVGLLVLPADLAYVSKVLIPRFGTDHPYIFPDIKATAQQQRRLVQFAETFGFGPDDWHVSRIAKQLERFLVPDPAERTRESVLNQLSNESAEMMEYIWSVSDHLNEIHRGDRRA